MTRPDRGGPQEPKRNHGSEVLPLMRLTGWLLGLALVLGMLALGLQLALNLLGALLVVLVVGLLAVVLLLAGRALGRRTSLALRPQDEVRGGHNALDAVFRERRG